MKCPYCGYENKEDARFCSLCQKSFVKDDAEPGELPPLAEPSPEAKKAVETILRGQPTGLNWFQRHLNWTWALPQLLLYVAALVVFYSLFFSAVEAVKAGEPFMLPFSDLVLFLGIIFSLLAAVQFGIGAWVLKRKERSLWWLLIFLIPAATSWLNIFVGFAAIVIVWIVFLPLENRSLPPLPELPDSPSQPGLAPPGLGSRSDKYGP